MGSRPRANQGRSVVGSRAECRKGVAVSRLMRTLANGAASWPPFPVCATSQSLLRPAEQTIPACHKPKQRIFGPAATATYCLPPAVKVMGDAFMRTLVGNCHSVFAVPLIDRGKAAVWLAVEDQTSSGGQHARPGFGARGSGLRNLPDDLARFDVERRAGIAGRSDRGSRSACRRIPRAP